MLTEYKSQVFNPSSNINNNIIKSRTQKNNDTKELNRNGKFEDQISNQDEETKKDKFCLPAKQFSSRDSCILQLFEENKSVKAVYNTFIANYLIFIFALTLKEYINHERLPKALYLIPRSFGKMHLVATIWIGNNVATCTTYAFLLFWGKTRQKVIYKKKIWDTIWILLLIGYYILSFVAITKAVFVFDIPFASALILTMESVRFLMKVHAFVRHNASRLLQESQIKTDFPEFSKFLHFLYVPTIVYRDQYPKSEKIRWGFVFFRITEIVNIVILLAYWYEYVVTPYFRESCLKTWSALEVFLVYIEFCVPAYMVLWLMFFVILHSIQNAVGEVLRFGDRLFYKDWWNCTNFQQYYRSWNLVIGDWLYTYVHKDICENFGAGNRNLAKFITILISALVHEWICTVTSGYFLPLVTLLMVSSPIFMSVMTIKKYSTTANVVYILMLMLGFNVIITFYALEHFTRVNFPSNQQFVSVFWTNNCVSL